MNFAPLMDLRQVWGETNAKRNEEGRFVHDESVRQSGKKHPRRPSVRTRRERARERKRAHLLVTPTLESPLHLPLGRRVEERQSIPDGKILQSLNSPFRRRPARGDLESHVGVARVVDEKEGRVELDVGVGSVLEKVAERKRGCQLQGNESWYARLVEEGGLT